MTPIRTWLLCFEHLSRKKEDFAWIDTHRLLSTEWTQVSNDLRWSEFHQTGLEIWPCSFTTARVSFPLATHCCEERVRRSLEAGLSSLSDCCHIGTGHNYIILPGTMAEFSYLDWTVQCSIVDQCCGSCFGRVFYFQPDPYQPVSQQCYFSEGRPWCQDGFDPFGTPRQEDWLRQGIAWGTTCWNIWDWVVQSPRHSLQLSKLEKLE